MPLELKNITKHFGEKNVFENFSYKFNENGVYALIGDSGKGKTTLLRIISGLDKDYIGTVNKIGIKKEIAYAFQEYRLFPTLSVIENLTHVLYRNPTKVQIDKARNMLLSFGFQNSELNLYPHALSGGMKQRVSLCRALLAETKVILLDEPFKELDDGLRDILRTFIKYKSKDSLVIISTHSEKMLEGLNATVLHI